MPSFFFPTLVALAFLLGLSSPVAARWSTPEDANYIREYETLDINVNADGTFSAVHEFEDKILKEPARRQAGTFRTAYNSNSSKFEILEAKTINDGVETPVAAKYIQDKPLASTGKGFDEIRQVLIAFPKVDIESRIHAKMKITTTQIPFANFFSDSFLFGNSRYEKKKRITIQSKLPLFVESFDPEGILTISKWKREGNYYVKIELRRPIYRDILDEEVVSVDGNFFPWVDVATTDKWEEMIRPVLSTYESIISATIPESFADIVTKAKSKQNTIAQVNFVTSQISERVHYLGDWRPINGGHVPRSLATIADSGFGDCKDMSALLAALLRNLGYTANVAFVFRGWNPVFSPTNLPQISAFNHAIVRAQKGDAVFWLDPTNLASFASGVFEDIIDRPTLVVDSNSPRMTRTPKAEPKTSVITADSTVDIDVKKRSYMVQGALSYAGRAAIPYTGATLNSSKQSIDYRIISSIGQAERMASWEVGKYDLSSREVRDLNIKFKYTENDAEYVTSAGPAFPLVTNWFVRRLLVPIKDRVSNLFLGQPLTYTNTIHLRNIELVGSLDTLGCSITSPWANLSRDLVIDHGQITVTEKVTVLQDTITNAVLKSQPYASFQRKIRRCFDGSALIYRPKRGAKLSETVRGS